MSSGDIALTAALRQNLLSLQNTQKSLDQTQVRLATGLKVNSALDDPLSFFAAQALRNRSTDLSRLLDGMGQGVQAIKAADDGITAMTDLLSQAQALAESARDALNADPAADVSQLASDFDDLMTQIDSLAGDAGYRGVNLLKASATLTITFSEASPPSTLAIVGKNLQTGVTNALDGLEVDDTATKYASWAAGPPGNASLNVDNAIADIKQDIAFIRNVASGFGTKLAIVQAREDFTAGLINTLRTGADKLTLADKNEEGAKLLSLQTTQSLGITSLSLASQANQAVLRLFQ